MAAETDHPRAEGTRGGNSVTGRGRGGSTEPERYSHGQGCGGRTGGDRMRKTPTLPPPVLGTCPVAPAAKVTRSQWVEAQDVGVSIVSRSRYRADRVEHEEPPAPPQHL